MHTRITSPGIRLLKAISAKNKRTLIQQLELILREAARVEGISLNDLPEV